MLGLMEPLRQNAVEPVQLEVSEGCQQLSIYSTKAIQIHSSSLFQSTSPLFDGIVERALAHVRLVSSPVRQVQRGDVGRQFEEVLHQLPSAEYTIKTQRWGVGEKILIDLRCLKGVSPSQRSV